MRTCIGIDGGGTSTRLLVQHEDACPEYSAQPLSIKVTNRGYAKSAETLRAILKEALHGDFSELHSIAIGLAGMSRKEDQENLKNAINALPELAQVSIHIDSDAMLTLHAALKHDEEGILLIAGTGSVAYVRAKGELHRLGGWGPALSDEGSGYWIGLKALQYFVLVYDGRGEEDVLYEAIEQALPKELRDNPVLLSQYLERHSKYPAQFAKIVFETMQESSVADGIVETAAGCLSALVKTGLDLLEEENTFPVWLSGSIAKNEKIVEYLGHMLFESKAELRLLETRAPVTAALDIAKSL